MGQGLVGRHLVARSRYSLLAGWCYGGSISRSLSFIPYCHIPKASFLVSRTKLDYESAQILYCYSKKYRGPHVHTLSPYTFTLQPDSSFTRDEPLVKKTGADGCILMSVRRVGALPNGNTVNENQSKMGKFVSLYRLVLDAITTVLNQIFLFLTDQVLKNIELKHSKTVPKDFRIELDGL